MSLGILGTKLGMTTIFDKETGVAIPVTAVQVGPCRVTQIKTKEKDGYVALQLGYDELPDRKRSLNTKEAKEVNKYLTSAEDGHLTSKGLPALRQLKEYRLDDVASYELGQTIGADLFNEGDLVDVGGKTIGRGFSGYQKRHNFKRGNMTHGSKNHRLPGSTGAGTTPGRVYPGKKMAGRYGNTNVKIRKLTVVKIDAERNLLLIKGAIPGKTGNLVSITPATIVGQQ
ncbi:LSU ribosomal protein L3 RplC [Cyanobacterium sp. HL-69]|uniref:50S ribosomal protein L3 n=1 Tax=unclassified Cyanobacterium TaxID=2629879 RepID=UPI0008526ECF|nr:50S ribosomal protein L3 [Cyanobacterium sp. IPPAS B-1200]AUC59847.1 LSU ribosomal protein L3 RplC [Cyanobacterium sp. HL-69]OEJ79189.1 50S ribosomal protein L3 [Cyanobacterium sp. IPPAS B-1200]